MTDNGYYYVKELMLRNRPLSALLQVARLHPVLNGHISVNFVILYIR